MLTLILGTWINVSYVQHLYDFRGDCFVKFGSNSSVQYKDISCNEVAKLINKVRRQ